MAAPSQPFRGPTEFIAVSGDYEFRTEIDDNSKVCGLRALHEILRLASRPHVSVLPDPESDTYYTIVASTLRLALDPLTIHHLATPHVMSGCIRLMKAAIDQNSQTILPPSHQYTWLCFTLLVVSFNMCNLVLWDKLDETLGLCKQETRFAPHAIAATHLALSVHNHLEAMGIAIRYDNTYQWPDSTLYPAHSVLILPSDALDLMDVLWRYRKYFLEAMILCSPVSLPGLSGLLFCLSGYINMVYQRNPQRPGPDVDTLRRRLTEVGMRYLLVADGHHGRATARVLQSSITPVKWAVSPKDVDAEDSRSILTAFIKKLSVEPESKVFTSREPFMLLQFVPLAIDPTAQSLVPEVMRYIMKYGWSMLMELERRSEDSRCLVEYVFAALKMSIVSYHGRPCDFSHSTQTRIMDEIYYGEILDLAARTILRLNPGDNEVVNEVLETIVGFFECIGDAISRDELDQFLTFSIDLRVKLQRHFVFTARGMYGSGPESYQRHYSTCMESWAKIFFALGYQPRRETETPIIMKCFNGRCPEAYVPSGARFSCGGCAQVWYCHNRCQSMGWNFGLVSGSHRNICGLECGR